VTAPEPTTAPSQGRFAQAAIEAFAGEWSSRLPRNSGLVSGGQAFLFEDRRLAWFLSRIGPLRRRSVLELGPLEGGHAYMLERAGAARIVSIEANSRAYLKCLIVAQLFGLRRTGFLHGDFIDYLDQDPASFDVALASGVLYHMRDPVRLIAKLAGRCRDLLVWTHYHDARRAAADPALASTLGAPEQVVSYGFGHTLIRKHYAGALAWGGFCGGSADYCCWMLRDELIGAFEHFGFVVRAIAFDRPDHPNGPALALHLRHG
jgi:hypothetical protein